MGLADNTKPMQSDLIGTMMTPYTQTFFVFQVQS